MVNSAFLERLEREINDALAPARALMALKAAAAASEAGQLPTPEELARTGPPLGSRGSFPEQEYAMLLAKTLPPIMTCGAQWRLYKSGVWQQVTRDELRPMAQRIMRPGMRNHRRERAVLEHLEGYFQAPMDRLKGFYMFDPSGAVLINARNCIVRVDSDGAVTTLAHSPEYPFCRQAAASYDPHAEAPLFRRIVSEALAAPQDQELFQLTCGNFLLPDCRYETALVCYGPGGTGKSTLAEAVTAALGESLVLRASLLQLCDPKSYSLPHLRFAAVNLTSELHSLAVEESANFKVIVSGEALEAREIYGNPFTMRTSAKLWFLANGLPRFKNGTDAELRRMRFLRFDRKPAQQDGSLKNRLASERDGIFRFMIEGLQKLLKLPTIPNGGESSLTVHERFKIRNDPVGAFVEDRCVFNPEGRVSKQTLREAFEEFCEKHAFTIEDENWFFRKLYERFPNLQDCQAMIGQDRVRCIRGLQLRATPMAELI